MLVVILNCLLLCVVGQVVFVFLQFGQSFDFVDSLCILCECGVLGIVLVNVEDLLLEVVSEFVVLFCVGVECSVVVIKSFIVMFSVSVCLFVYWQCDNVLLVVGQGLVVGLEQVVRFDWLLVIEVLCDCQWLMVIGCGVGYVIVQEVVLKFKEILVIQVEVFSSVEVCYGLMVLVEECYLLLVFVFCGLEQEGLLVFVEDMCQCGVQVLFVVLDDIVECDLLLQCVVYLVFDLILVIQSFYVMVVGLVEVCGMDLDQLWYLSKVI